MPMLRMAMYAKNVAIYCAPTADDRDTWQSTMQHIALEGRCFVDGSGTVLLNDPGKPEAEPKPRPEGDKAAGALDSSPFSPEGITTSENW